MGDPSNPNVGPGPEPDPDQPGWASPAPPPPAAPPAADPPPPDAPPTVPPAPVPPAPQPAAPVPPAAWGTPSVAGSPPVWATPPPAGPTPPAGGGAGWTPGPRPKKRRLTWLWILIPTLLVFAVSTVVVIVFVAKLVLGPVETTNDYYADLHDRDYVAAYGKLCFAIQRDVSQDRYVQLQESDTRSKGAVEDYDFSSSHIENGTATTTGTVVRSGSEYNATIGLRKEDGDWKICSIRER